MKKKTRLPSVIDVNSLDGIACLMVAETEILRKQKGERDTEFVKRIVAAYLTAWGINSIMCGTRRELALIKDLQ